jgi:hypothetical protein
MTGSVVYPKTQTKGSCVARMVPKSRDNAKVAQVELMKEPEELAVSPMLFNIPLFWNNPWETIPLNMPYVTFAA